uniref:Cystatin LXN-type domain-containing protein n=1 Tax=Sinocyclocheilus anshuiensis TaxID=1608454 RepID=A0A671LKE2_9TELE
MMNCCSSIPSKSTFLLGFINLIQYILTNRSQMLSDIITEGKQQHRCHAIRGLIYIKPKCVSWGLGLVCSDADAHLGSVSSRSCYATALRSINNSTGLRSSPERIMKTFCSVWLLLSVVELSPAPPASQEPPQPEGPALRCSADVLFPRTERHSAPDVKLRCEALQQINRTAQEQEAFYQKHITPDSAVSARDIPDSYGNMSEEMQTFWRLAHVAASFIMLRESSENTEFNMAQVASVTQQESSEEQLMLEFVVLLHDLPSQEIVQWKLLASWSPDRGVRVLQTEWQPRCPHATKPPN